jgi:HTH-type transcriptional regulator/antitoxin HigA
MKVTTPQRNAVGDRYLELVRQFPLRPLRTKADYTRATEVMDVLAVREEGALSRDERDYLDTLALLIEEYDSRRSSPLPAEPVEVLRHLMEAHDMNTSDLGRVIGSRGVASEILNGKRSLSKAHMARLAEKFHVDVGVFFPAARTR